MNTSSGPTASDIRRSLHLLRSPDSRERMHAIHVLEYVGHDPRVSQLFEYLCRNDPDPRVRRAAWRAVTRDGPSIPAPGPAGTPENAPGAGGRLPAGEAGTRVFLFDPANRRVLKRECQRRAQRRRSARIPFVLAAILLVIALVLAVQVAPAVRDWYRLDRSGITVEGTITALDVDGDAWHMTYRFETAHSPDAAPQTNTQRLTRAAYERLAVGQPVTVMYWPDDPALAATGQPDPAHHLRDRQAIAAVVVGLIAVLFAGLGVMLARDRRPPHRQHLVPGHIVACEGRLDADGDFKLRVRFRFTSPATGHTITAQKAQIRNDLRQAELPEPGTPVAVYYRDDRAFWLL